MQSEAQLCSTKGKQKTCRGSILFLKKYLQQRFKLYVNLWRENWQTFLQAIYTKHRKKALFSAHPLQSSGLFSDPLSFWSISALQEQRLRGELRPKWIHSLSSNRSRRLRFGCRAICSEQQKREQAFPTNGDTNSSTCGSLFPFLAERKTPKSMHNRTNQINQSFTFSCHSRNQMS